MRRIPRTSTGVSPVKKQQEELSRSVNQEQAHLESLQDQVKSTATDLDLIIEKRDGAAEDLEGKLDKVGQVNIELTGLTNQKNELVVQIQSAQSDLVKAQDELVAAKQQAKTVVHAAGEEAQRTVDSNQTKVNEITKRFYNQQTLLDSITHECGRKKVELDRVITDTQSESVVLRQLNQQVADRKRDLVNLEGAVVRQESRLADVQEAVRQTEHTEGELKAKIEWQTKILRDIESNIELKRSEELGLHERILAIALKEDRIKDFLERAKKLYAKAGITIDLDI